MNDLILQLYSRPETVFTINEISQLLPNVSSESLRDRLYYFTKVGKLIHLHQGIYAKKDYDAYELANKVYTPSYISLETVLCKSNVVFQYYTTIFLVSYLTRAIKVAGVDVQYRQIKREVLTNMQGIEQVEGYFVATRERAFMDAVYIYHNYHFDNLGAIDWEKIAMLKSIYNNKAFEKRIDEYYEIYKEEYAKDTTA